MGEILITVIISAAIPIAYVLLYRIGVSRDRRKALRNDVISVERSLLLCGMAGTVFFYSVTVLCGILSTIFLPAYVTYILVSIFGLISALGALGCVNDKFKYIIIEDEQITSVSMFFKDKVFPYSDVKNYLLPNFRGRKGIVLYGHDGKKLFSSGVGCDGKLYNLTYKLNDIGIFTMPDSEIKAGNKREIPIFIAVTLALMGAMLMLPFGLTYSHNQPPETYMNYRVSGVVAEFKFKDGDRPYLKLTLENDDHVYWVYSVVYDKLDKDLQKNLSRGDRIRLLIAHDESGGKRKVSQIELNGRIYLSAEKAETAEMKSYRTNRTFAFVFLGIACAFFAGTTAAIIYYFYVRAQQNAQN